MARRRVVPDEYTRDFRVQARGGKKDKITSVRPFARCYNDVRHRELRDASSPRATHTPTRARLTRGFARTASVAGFARGVATDHPARDRRRHRAFGVVACDIAACRHDVVVSRGLRDRRGGVRRRPPRRCLRRAPRGVSLALAPAPASRAATASAAPSPSSRCRDEASPCPPPRPRPSRPGDSSRWTPPTAPPTTEATNTTTPRSRRSPSRTKIHPRPRPRARDRDPATRRPIRRSPKSVQVRPVRRRRRRRLRRDDPPSDARPIPRTRARFPSSARIPRRNASIAAAFSDGDGPRPRRREPSPTNSSSTSTRGSRGSFPRRRDPNPDARRPPRRHPGPNAETHPGDSRPNVSPRSSRAPSPSPRGETIPRIVDRQIGTSPRWCPRRRWRGFTR